MWITFFLKKDHTNKFQWVKNNKFKTIDIFYCIKSIGYEENNERWITNNKIVFLHQNID